MIHLTTHEVDDLKQCQRSLERVLITLDTAGAGIAAIHVNAAIEQLKKNVSVLVDDEMSAGEQRFLFPDKNQ